MILSAGLFQQQKKGVHSRIKAQIKETAPIDCVCVGRGENTVNVAAFKTCQQKKTLSHQKTQRTTLKHRTIKLCDCLSNMEAALSTDILPV